MKKMIVVCFAFLFLLSIVAGCPSGGSDLKSGGNSDSTFTGGEGGLSSSDSDTDEIISE